MTPSTALCLRRGAALLAVAVTVAVGPAAPATAAATTPRPASSAQIAAQVRALDREVTRVGTALAAQVVRYEQAQDRLARLTSDRMNAREDAETRAAEAEQARASSAGLARRAYKGGVPPLVAALLSGDPRTVSDLAYVRRSVAALGVQGGARAERAEQRARTAGHALDRSDADRRTAVVLQQAVDAQLATLVTETERLSARLAVAADALVAARADEAARGLAAARARERAAAAARAAAALRSAPTALPPLPTGPEADGGTCGPPSTLGEANGFLPASTLCALSTGRGHRLRTDAAAAFERLATAYAASLGQPLCVTDSYRSYPEQVDVFARKPSLAAVPGTSQHGWGLALDLCGGVQSFGSPAHEWLRAHAQAFGWHHPRWAQQGGRKPEPWHWEFVPDR